MNLEILPYKSFFKSLVSCIPNLKNAKGDFLRNWQKVLLLLVDTLDFVGGRSKACVVGSRFNPLLVNAMPQG